MIFRTLAALTLSHVAFADPPSSVDELLEGFTKTRSGITVILADTDTDVVADVADAVVDTHEAVSELVGSILEEDPCAPPETINVLVFSSKEAFEQYLLLRGVDQPVATHGVHASSVRFTIGGITEICVWIGDVPVHRVIEALRREIVYLTIESNVLAPFPSAVREGLAGLFASRLDADERRYGESRVALRRLLTIRTMIENRDYVRCDRLLVVSDGTFDEFRHSGTDVYAQAWSLVHFLRYADGGRHAKSLSRFIGACRTYSEPSVALELAFGATEVPAMTDQWVQHWMSRRLIPLDAAPDIIAMVLESVTTADACTIEGVVRQALELNEQIDGVGLRIDVESRTADRTVLSLEATEPRAGAFRRERIARILVESVDGVPQLRLLDRIPVDIRGTFRIEGDRARGRLRVAS